MKTTEMHQSSRKSDFQLRVEIPSFLEDLLHLVDLDVHQLEFLHMFGMQVNGYLNCEFLLKGLPCEVLSKCKGLGELNVLTSSDPHNLEYHLIVFRDGFQHGDGVAASRWHNAPSLAANRLHNGSSLDDSFRGGYAASRWRNASTVRLQTDGARCPQFG